MKRYGVKLKADFSQKTVLRATYDLLDFQNTNPSKISHWTVSPAQRGISTHPQQSITISKVKSAPQPLKNIERESNRNMLKHSKRTQANVPSFANVPNKNISMPGLFCYL